MAWGPQQIPRRDKTLNSRERILTTLAHQEPDRVPTVYAAEAAITDRLYQHFGVSDLPALFRALDTDGFMSGIGWVHPRYVGPPVVQMADGAQADFWGIVLQRRWPIAFARAVGDLDAYRWPSPDWFDYSEIAAACAAIKAAERITIGGEGSCGIYQSINMRGYELALTDPLVNPELTHAYLTRMSDFFVEWNRRWLDAGQGAFDLFRCGDEVGAMDRLLCQPDQWRRVYKPHLQRVWAVAKQRGIRPWWHCCGYCRPLLDDIVEIGMEVWDSVPPNVHGNDMPELKRIYGDYVTFVGGVDHILMVRGTPEDVVREVRLRLDQLAPGGGCILGPGQAFTADTPLENVLAFYEAAHRYGEY